MENIENIETVVEALEAPETLEAIEDFGVLERIEPINKPKPKMGKHIIFKVSDKDHQLIKKFAARKKMSIRTIIIDAIAAMMKREIQRPIE